MNNIPSNGRAVLWDLDGTLIDTGTVHWQAWRGVLANEGLDLTWEKFVPGFGQRNDNVLRLWLGPDLSDAEVVRIAGIKESTYRAILKQQPPILLPGTEHWLAALRAAGWRQALATMTPRLNLEAIFEVVKTSSGQPMRDFFDAVVTADDVHHSKPDPEVFLLAASRLGMPPEHCVVVEDSPA